MDGAIEQDADGCQQQDTTANDRNVDGLEILYFIHVPPFVSHLFTCHQESHEETQRHDEGDGEECAHTYRDDTHENVPTRLAVLFPLLCKSSLLHLSHQVLRIHLLALHLQRILSCFRKGGKDDHQQIGTYGECREQDTQNDQWHGYDSENWISGKGDGECKRPETNNTEPQHTENHKSPTPCVSAATKILRTASQHTSQQLVLRITEKLLVILRLLRLLRLGIIAGFFRRLSITSTCNLLHLTNLVDDGLHLLNVDGLNTLCLQVVKQLCDTLLNVVRSFFATLLLPEVVTQGVSVVAQQFVSILINLVESATKIDGNILFHKAISFYYNLSFVI